MNTETIAMQCQTTTASGGTAEQGAGEFKRGVHPPRLQRILVAVDFSEFSVAALNYAGFLAEKFGATLTLVHSVEPYIYPEDLSAGFPIEELDARWLQKAKDKLESLRQTIMGGAPSTIVVTMGAAWNRIVGTAKSMNADMIVVGTHGRTGIKHALMGSTAERVSRHATCPVLVVHCPETHVKVTRTS
jgi:universal stress protein A